MTSSLTHFDLSYSLLFTLPLLLSDLSYNNIRELHDLDFYDISNVKNIDLSHSNIQRITGRPFENLTKLETL